MKEFPIETVERLIKLSREREADLAKRAFADAMNAVQGEMEPVRKRGRNTHTGSRFAYLEEVVRMLDPLVHAHGFSRSISTGECQLKDHIRVVLTLRHVAGHQETHSLDAPIDDKGPKGGDVKTRLHGMGSTLTYCERVLICKVFGVQVIPDDDGNAGSGVGPGFKRITADQVADVLSLLEETKSNERQFLDVFGVEKVEELATNQLRSAMVMLEAKRRRV